MSRGLESIVVELGLAEYLSAFVENGFDSRDALLDIQESDLDALAVKLGHRRKLQRHIARDRGIASHIPLFSAGELGADDDEQHTQRKTVTCSVVGSESTNRVIKRKYRHHPKRDENAPERPLSAYVLFSNKMREVFKGHTLSFIEIAKLVGENWRSLNECKREHYESQAKVAKEHYRERLAEYKKCPEYRRYAHYLQNFKEKQQSRHRGGHVHPANVISRRHNIGCGPTSPRIYLDSSLGSATATPIGGISLFTTGSGSSGQRLRESELQPYCEIQDASAAIAQLQLSSETALPQGSLLDENCISLQNYYFGKEGPKDRRCYQGPPSCYTSGTNHSEPNDQHLPTLLDGLDGKGQSAFAPGPLYMAKRSPLMYPGNEDPKGTVKYADGSVVMPASERLSTGSTNSNAKGFDAMSALLQAAELLAVKESQTMICYSPPSEEHTS